MIQSFLLLFAQGKLGWLRAELRERHHVEKRLRSNVRDAMETTTKDHTYYVNELQRQTDAMEALHKQGMHEASVFIRFITIM